MDNFKRYRFVSDKPEIEDNKDLWNTEKIGNSWETYSFLSKEEAENVLLPYNISGLKEEKLSLEDAFIGLTGKY